MVCGLGLNLLVTSGVHIAQTIPAMPRLIAIKALPGLRLWLEYSDGSSGVVDLSHLKGRGVFSIWDEPGLFEAVRLGPLGEVAWSESVDVCPDSLYLTLTGKSLEEALGSTSEA